MVELKHVDAGYGKQVRIHGVDMVLRQDELTAVAGPNGPGKGTMIKSMVGLGHIFSGAVLIRGEDAGVLGNKKIARLVSYLPQNRNLPTITAQKMALHDQFPYQSYPRHCTDEDRQYVKGAMEELGIWELRHQYMANLSSGERQKMYLAMALAGDTREFLLDEPTTWLDIYYQIGLVNILKEPQNENRTIAVVLHDLNAALQFANKIMMTERGRAVTVDTPERIYESQILERIFHIDSHYFHDEDGKSYYYFH